MYNQNPEQIARDKIDKMLIDTGWVVQSKGKIDLSANKGVAVREYQTDVGPADYVLFVERKPVGIIEVKREDEGFHLTSVEEQSNEYAGAKLKYLKNEPLPFIYDSTGTLTRFTDKRDPKPRSRRVFSFHRPGTIEQWIKQGRSLRDRLQDIPPLDPAGLRPAQIVAIENLEASFKKDRPKALIQMATGSGKTFTAATFIYRLLKHANAKRVCFWSIQEPGRAGGTEIHDLSAYRRQPEVYRTLQCAAALIPTLPMTARCAFPPSSACIPYCRVRNWMTVRSWKIRKRTAG